MSLSLRTVALSALALLVTVSASLAQAAPPSGMLLGVYAFENYRGLRITDTISGYSAEGRLFAGDVLQQATVDGSEIYSIRTLNEIEWAKDRIGPNTPAAIEVFRPGVGTIYFWVEFLPVGGAPAARAYTFGANGNEVRSAPTQMKAQFKTEKERPGARALFNGGQLNGGNFNGGKSTGSQQGRPNGLDQGGNFRDRDFGNIGPRLPQRPLAGQGNPGSLFGR